MNNLTLHLEKLIKEKQAKPEATRRNKIIKIGTEINRKTLEGINKTKNWFFNKVNK